MNYKAVLLKIFETTKKQKKTKTTVSLRSLRETLCGLCVEKKLGTLRVGLYSTQRPQRKNYAKTAKGLWFLRGIFFSSLFILSKVQF